MIFQGTPTELRGVARHKHRRKVMRGLGGKHFPRILVTGSEVEIVEIAGAMDHPDDLGPGWHPAIQDQIMANGP